MRPARVSPYTQETGTLSRSATSAAVSRPVMRRILPGFGGLVPPGVTFGTLAADSHRWHTTHALCPQGSGHRRRPYPRTRVYLLGMRVRLRGELAGARRTVQRGTRVQTDTPRYARSLFFPARGDRVLAC